MLSLLLACKHVPYDHAHRKDEACLLSKTQGNLILRMILDTSSSSNNTGIQFIGEKKGMRMPNRIQIVGLLLTT